MSDLVNEIYYPLSLKGVAASITGALGVDAPNEAEAPLDILLKLIEGNKIDRVLMYNPDAVALWLLKNTPIFSHPLC